MSVHGRALAAGDGADAFTYAIAGAGEREAESTSEWRAEFVVWLSFSGMDGAIAARGQAADVHATFADLLEGTDSMFGANGRLEVGAGRWGGFVESMYCTLNADDQGGPLGVADVDVGVDQFMLDFGLLYRLGESDPVGKGRAITVDLYGGGRYNHIELEVDPATLARREQSEDWVDPIVGARLVYPFGERWRVLLSGDVGGFGVQSDFTWSATGVIGYDFNLLGAASTLYAGYRATGWDFTEGSGTEQFTFDVVSHGPIVGLAVTF